MKDRAVESQAVYTHKLYIRGRNITDIIRGRIRIIPGMSEIPLFVNPHYWAAGISLSLLSSFRASCSAVSL
jgi:hypothetical protein